MCPRASAFNSVVVSRGPHAQPIPAALQAISRHHAPALELRSPCTAARSMPDHSHARPVLLDLQVIFYLFSWSLLVSILRFKKMHCLYEYIYSIKLYIKEIWNEFVSTVFSIISVFQLLHIFCIEICFIITSFVWCIFFLDVLRFWSIRRKFSRKFALITARTTRRIPIYSDFFHVKPAIIAFAAASSPFPSMTSHAFCFSQKQ